MKFSSSYPIRYQCFQMLEQNNFNWHLFQQISKPKKVGPSKTCRCNPYKLFSVSFVLAQYTGQFGCKKVDFWFARFQCHLLDSFLTKININILLSFHHPCLHCAVSGSLQTLAYNYMQNQFFISFSNGLIIRSKKQMSNESWLIICVNSFMHQSHFPST